METQLANALLNGAYRYPLLGTCDWIVIVKICKKVSFQAQYLDVNDWIRIANSHEQTCRFSIILNVL